MDDPRQLLLSRKAAPATFSPPSYYSTTTQSPIVPQLDGQAAIADESIDADMDLSNLSHKSQWIILAVASGACAAFNGVFAKLTTTELTTSFASAIAGFLGLGNGKQVVEVGIRGTFFALNLIFNGVMWTLFTKALARGTSTTQVSIINTSSNFMITAILGFLIFTESLPPLWWLGAALLVAGNVIIGRREEKEGDPINSAHGAAENGEGTYSEEEDVLLGEELEMTNELEASLKSQDDADILDMDEPPTERVLNS